MTEPHVLTEEEEIEFEIDMIDNEIQILQSRREFLCHQKTLLLHHRIECQQQPISLDDDNEEEEKKERETEENEKDEILSAKMQNILSEIFHFPALRPGQYDLIKYSYLNYDIFGVMKTSGGKSLCYQLLAFLFDHNCFILVVSPLIALIYDQVNYMNKILPGSAIALAGTMDRSQSSDIYRQMDQIGSISSQTGAKRSSNPLKLIFVTPEKIINSKLLMSHLQKAFDRNALARIVIDEAHCASQWGHDFRTDYSKLHILRTVFPTVPMMLLTATANLTVRKDVIQMMRLGTPSSRPRKQSLEGFNSSLLSIQGLKVFVSDFDRPNLQFDVLRKPSEFSDCLDLIIAVIMETIPHLNSQTREAPNMKSRSGHVIIYCFSQKDCEKVAVGLSERGYSASPYHAGLDDRLRQQIQENWMNGSRPHQIICATIAFGLGINVPTVRLVLHFTISKSLELYYQEAGRAGRDGDPARCVILYAPEDVFRIACLAVGDVEHCPVTHRVRPKVFTMIRYCHSKLCRRISFQEALESSHIINGKNSTQEPSATCIFKRSQQSIDLNQSYELCDNCRRQSTQESPHVSVSFNEDHEAIQLIFETIKGIIIRHEQSSDARDNKSSLTLNKLMNTSEVKSMIKELKKKNKASSSSTSDLLPSLLYDWEYLVVTMIERSYLDLSVHFTPYSTICYIASGDGVLSSTALLEYLRRYYLKLPMAAVTPLTDDDREVRQQKKSKKRVIEVKEEEDDERRRRHDEKIAKAENQQCDEEPWIDLTNE